VMSFELETQIHDMDPSFMESLSERGEFSNNPNFIAGFFLDRFRHTGVAKQCDRKIPHDLIQFEDNHKFAFYEFNSSLAYYCKRR